MSGAEDAGRRPAEAMPERNLLSSPASPREPSTPSLAVNRHPCEIRFQNLSFHVPHKGEGGLPILNGVTGVCRASKMVAVMGPSGAGKSTLVCLATILGLNKITYICLRSGRLCADGLAATCRQCSTHKSATFKPLAAFRTLSSVVYSTWPT